MSASGKSLKATRKRQLRALRDARRLRPRRLKKTGQHVVYSGERCVRCGWNYLDIAIYTVLPWACPPTDASPDLAEAGESRG